MKNKAKKIFSKIKPQFLNSEYNQILNFFINTKNICSKKGKEIECENAVDRFTDLVNNFNKK